MPHVLNIIAVIKKSYADSMEDAELLLPLVETAIKNRQKIDLSFQGMNICSTIFLNNFLGKLYLTYGTKVDDFVNFIGFDEDNNAIPNKIDRLKKRALNPDAFTAIYQSATSNP